MKYFTAFLLLFVMTISAQAQDRTQVVFREIPPTWPGCSGSRTELQTCFRENLTKHIIENYTFPENYKQTTPKQKVIVKFIINTVGKVEITSVTGGTPELQAEAKKNILSIPEMKPGNMKGAPTNAKYTVPFTF